MNKQGQIQAVGVQNIHIRTSVYLKWLQVKYLLAIVLQLALSTRLVMYVYLSEQGGEGLAASLPLAELIAKCTWVF